MITSIFVRHFKIYKGISFIPLSTGNFFSSLIGENGAGKSSILEAIDFILNKKNTQDWPVNNEAKSDGGIGGSNTPYIALVFLIRKDTLHQSKKEEKELYNKASKMSEFLWGTSLSKEFGKHRDELKECYNKEDYFLIMIGRRHSESGMFFGPFHNSLTFITNSPSLKYEDLDLQRYFKGFNDYIISHYTYIYIPVETDVETYTKLETQDMQELMDKNIQEEIIKAIKPGTLKQINKDLDAFVSEIETTLKVYEYKGRFKNSLTMPDLVAKIIEAYFSIKFLNRRSSNGKYIPVKELSSGEKRKALIDVAYSFLIHNKNKNTHIILAIDEPEASLHISNCYNQFEKLIELSRNNHQIIISTHWYGYLPIVTIGSATAIRHNKDTAKISFDYLNLYNYRESIAQSKKMIKSQNQLPIDYKIKSYNDLVQSILHSLIQDEPYNWIICEGFSEKIYFETFFKKEIENNNLRILPLGGFKEVRKLYSYLLPLIKDPDYQIKGKVVCLIDTDLEMVNVSSEKNPHLLFKRLINTDKGTILHDVNHNLRSPATEIEDCLNPILFYQTLLDFTSNYQNLDNVLNNSKLIEEAKSSSTFMDLRQSEVKIIKDFFDDNKGYNKVDFARKYVEISKRILFKNISALGWIQEIKNILTK